MRYIGLDFYSMASLFFQQSYRLACMPHHDNHFFQGLPANAARKVRLREIMEKQVIETNIQHEGKLKELYNRLAFEQDNEFIRDFFDEARNERKQKMRERLQRWKESDNTSFDKLWESLKRDVLTKQEN